MSSMEKTFKKGNATCIAGPVTLGADFYFGSLLQLAPCLND